MCYNGYVNITKGQAMAKLTTIKLNERQVATLKNALHEAINPNYPLSDEHNARIVRIIKKLEKTADQQ